MKCLTVKQYWAWAIVAGHKSVENRTWSTRHRGPLAIHAGQATDPKSRAALEALGLDVPEAIEAGAVIGIVDLVDVVPYSSGQPHLPGVEDDLADDPLATGPFCWIVRNPRPLDEPVPLRGMPGLFEVDLP
jgi:hypothetical protein